MEHRDGTRMRQGPGHVHIHGVYCGRNDSGCQAHRDTAFIAGARASVCANTEDEVS